VTARTTKEEKGEEEEEIGVKKKAAMEAWSSVSPLL
jgi:hypothetical protein